MCLKVCYKNGHHHSALKIYHCILLDILFFEDFNPIHICGLWFLFNFSLCSRKCQGSGFWPHLKPVLEMLNKNKRGRKSSHKLSPKQF